MHDVLWSLPSRIRKEKSLFQLGVRLPHCLEKVGSVVSRWEGISLFSLFCCSPCDEKYFKVFEALSSMCSVLGHLCMAQQREACSEGALPKPDLFLSLSPGAPAAAEGTLCTTVGTADGHWCWWCFFVTQIEFEWARNQTGLLLPKGSWQMHPASGAEVSH